MTSHGAWRLTPLAFGVPCVAAVMICGELSTGALLAVGTTGAALAGVGLARRAGAAAPPVGRRGWPWLVWLAAAVTWEVLTLFDGDLPTLRAFDGSVGHRGDGPVTGTTSTLDTVTADKTHRGHAIIEPVHADCAGRSVSPPPCITGRWRAFGPLGDVLVAHGRTGVECPIRAISSAWVAAARTAPVCRRSWKRRSRRRALALAR